MAKTSFYTGSGTSSNAISALESLKDQAQTSATNAASSATAAASSASTAASNATAAASSATSAAASVASLSTEVATQSEKGLMSAADKTKLDGVESGATADQTAAEIKTAYESNSDTNAFTDAEQTKLSGIESSADVTDATNVQAAGALMDSEVTSLSGIKTLTVPDSTTVSTFGASLVDDADAAAARTTLGLGTAATTASTAYATAAQGSTADAALPKAGGTMTGAITFASGQTFDGRDVSADGTKLDTIETNADVTDATNVQAAGALMDSELTSEASVKAINQGLATTDSPTFAGLTATGDIDINAGQDIALAGGSGSGLVIQHTGSYGFVKNYTGDLYIYNETNDGDVNILTDNSSGGTTTYIKANGANGEVQLFHYGSERLNTTASGVDISGQVYVTGDIVLEGATADDFETTVTATDPTADRTITLPDASGNIAVQTSDGFLQVQSASGSGDVGINLDAVGSTTRSNFLIGPYAAASQDHWSIEVDQSNVEDYSSLTFRVDDQTYIRFGPNTTSEVSEMVYIQKPTMFSPNATGTPLVFEGTTTDANELRINVTDPTADRTITLPDQTGTAMLWQSKWPDDPGSASDNIAIGGSALSSLTTGINNTGVGQQALEDLSTGSRNTTLGQFAGGNITTGSYNTAVGSIAMNANTTDSNSTAVGYYSGSGNFLTSGTYVGAYAGNYNSSSKDYQTAVGAYSMNDCFGDRSTAVGYNAMSDGNHYQSVAVGYSALARSSTGNPYYNVAVGANCNSTLYSADNTVAVGYSSQAIYEYSTSVGALASAVGIGSVSLGYGVGNSFSTNSDYSVIIGNRAGFDMDGGDYCTFVGHEAGYAGGTGSYNTGYGAFTLDGLTTGQFNVAFGSSALGQCTTASKNTGIGHNAGYGITSGGDNTFLGMNAGWAQDSVSTGALTTGSNVTCLGFEAMPSSATATNEITLGDNDITSLRCNVQTISSLSDERDKTAIADIPYGLDFINDMRPVQFTWNRRDGSLGAKPDIGFIAQELNDVELNHSSSSRTRLVSWENPEKLEADYVRSYPILVKAVQELSAKCDALEARLAALEGA